jgi:hypothetical protein
MDIYEEELWEYERAMKSWDAQQTKSTSASEPQ